jgi:hypothetical protein
MTAYPSLTGALFEAHISRVIRPKTPIEAAFNTTRRAPQIQHQIPEPRSPVCAQANDFLPCLGTCKRQVGSTASLDDN